jgi:hypothetical protein
MEMPVAKGATSSSGDFTSYEVQQPQYDDLAASRLQTKVATMSRDLWEGINNPQQLRYIKSMFILLG